MQFGKRNIRSAGRSSGSVEITLPVDLGILEGVGCHLGLRDGLMPEIVLRPDLRGVVTVFETCWDRLGLGLEEVGAIGDFSEADYVLGLFPAAKWSFSPPLAYADGLIIGRSLAGEGAADQSALEAFARLVESMAEVAGRRLALADDLAAVFGNQVADLLSGGAIDRRDAFMRGLASDTVGALHAAERGRMNPLGPESWRNAQGELGRLYDQFASWTGEPQALAKAREHWYRARRFEARVGTTRV